MPRAIWRRVRLERWVVYASIVFVAAVVVWITTTWMNYLAERTEEAEQQTEHMTELLRRSETRQEQMATLIREFRESVATEEASRREFEAKADAILKALDVQVERMSHEAEQTSAPRLRRVVGQAGGRPRARQPPEEAEPEPAQPEPTHDRPPKHEHPPKPKPRAQPAPPPRSQPPPQSSKPPQAKREPPANSQQASPSRPGKADPPGKAKGHRKQPPAKGRR